MSHYFSKSTSPFIVATMVFLSSSTAHASGGPSDPVPQFVNLLILGAALFLVYSKVLKPQLVERAEAIKNELEKGQKELEIAKAHSEEINKEYAQLDAKIAEIHAQANADIEALKVTFKEQMVAEDERIAQSTARSIQDELIRAKRELQEESVEIALSIAEDLVKRNVSSDDHARFQTTFIQAVEKEGSNV